MTSLAVFPLQRTMTDLTDDDLYQAPAIGTVFANAAGPAYSAMSFSSTGAATAELLQILNVPDNFFEDYSRRNTLSPSLNSGLSQSQDGFDICDEAYDTPQRGSPYAGYVHLDAFDAFGQAQLLDQQQYQQQQYQHQSQWNSQPNTQPQHQYQLHQYQSHQYQQHQYQHPQSQHPHQQQPAFVQPQLIQMRSNMHTQARKGRITTLGDHEAPGSMPMKDDDFFLFNCDIQPSQMLANKNYFNTEDTMSPSLYIMNGDLDHAPVPRDSAAGASQLYVPMDEFVEDAEALSEDSDDDNCFQDDDGFDDRAMSHEQLPGMLPFTHSPQANFMKIVPTNELSLQSSPVENKYELHTTQDSSMSMEKLEGPDSGAGSRKSSLDSQTDMMHITKDYHKTAAEISATNPEHQCDLVNPSSGKVCNRKFSRPYDLIRHQETIHASEKKIYRCVICEGRANGGPGNGKQKTFSRNDALSRHIKVKHGLAGQEALDLINEAKENVEYVAV
ncbi:hypothetical protein METBIDRAFT_77466 [Metschnikowia bicuspidata var. bicuspidata NRRL YB-4993]|uniref:C2H2-type domain-containing protein n=1 Tax=Metschnikowia bicuspidata var. bicuspidata NRRL YB-4993 TaxID=869754 RepID=A0A1A0HD76_9ASCO|nr:hypothetical protein METBIDRAFT_77466 [Metschnikowia bicuspidata var. bicuspidata NRRL YB-4993]OBA21925.1 hypothetical protein METBIDRAFT_77466 [Metschnikowia bicuspidata var. bicuspidata NRRL YB-4993]